MLRKYNSYKQLKEENNIGIYSFYKSNVASEIIKKQKLVFEHFGLTINQILDDDITHGDFLNKTINDANTPDFLIFFDIDCIPLNKKAITKLVSQIRDRKSIAGAAQTANQFLQGKNIYVGPFFFGISKTVYWNLNSPDMNDGAIWDVGGLLTMVARFQREVNIRFWYPSSVEVPKWNLYKKCKFGLGTTYEKLVYHAFESRLGESDNAFVKKCNEILKQTI